MNQNKINEETGEVISGVRVRTTFNFYTDKDFSIDLTRKEENIYTKKTDDTGAITLVKTGTTNVYEKIQEWLPETLIYNKIAQYKNGDLHALDRKPCDSYGDASVLPTNIHETNAMFKKANKNFEKLPHEMKKTFGFDPKTFLENCSLEQLKEYVKRKQAEAKTSEDKKEENE